MVTHVDAHIMHRYPQKEEILEEFNLKFSELIQAVPNQDLKRYSSST